MDTTTWRVKRICSECPFRKDGTPFLGRERAEEIANSIGENGEAFACHKTLETRNLSCMGAIATLAEEEKPNQIMQIANRLLGDIAPIDESAFSSLSDFVDHHTLGE